MFIGKVVGTVVATKKSDGLTGKKLLIVSRLKGNFYAKDDFQVAIDCVGAGIGETVLIVTGSAARVTVNNEKCPVDASIVGIIDTFELVHDEMIFKQDVLL